MQQMLWLPDDLEAAGDGRRPEEFLATLAIPGFKPHYYQRDGFLEVHRRLIREGHASTAVVMPTGTGKTILFGLWARYVTTCLGGRVLVLAHTDELIDQARGKLDWLGVPTLLEKARDRALHAAEVHRIFGEPPRVVVGSVATLGRATPTDSGRVFRRLARWPRDYFSDIICDEAHHDRAEQYEVIYQHFRGARILKVTATPERGDGQAIRAHSLAYRYTLPQAISDRFLKRVRVKQSPVQIDLSEIRSRPVGGDDDFDQAQLDEVIAANLEPLANAVKEHLGSRRGIAFTPLIRSGELMADALNDVGIPAAAISGKSKDRKTILDSFRDGAHQVLCNAQLLTEGVDLPFVDFIALCKPSQSPIAVPQMVGRGLRRYDLDNPDEDCLVLDFSWVVRGKKTLVRPVHLLAPETATREDLDLCQTILDAGTTVDCKDLADAVEGLKREMKAQDLLEQLEREERERQRALAVQIRERPTGWRFREIDAVGLVAAQAGADDAPVGHRDIRMLPPTRPMIEKLLKWGAKPEEVARMSRREAGKLIGWCIQQFKKGGITLRQLETLMGMGVDRRDLEGLTMLEASDMIDDRIARRRRT